MLAAQRREEELERRRQVVERWNREDVELGIRIDEDFNRIKELYKRHLGVWVPPPTSLSQPEPLPDPLESSLTGGYESHASSSIHESSTLSHPQKAHSLRQDDDYLHRLTMLETHRQRIFSSRASRGQVSPPPAPQTTFGLPGLAGPTHSPVASQRPDLSEPAEAPTATLQQHEEYRFQQPRPRTRQADGAISPFTPLQGQPRQLPTGSAAAVSDPYLAQIAIPSGGASNRETLRMPEPKRKQDWTTASDNSMHPNKKRMSEPDNEIREADDQNFADYRARWRRPTPRNHAKEEQDGTFRCQWVDAQNRGIWMHPFTTVAYFLECPECQKKDFQTLKGFKNHYSKEHEKRGITVKDMDGALQHYGVQVASHVEVEFQLRQQTSPSSRPPAEIAPVERKMIGEVEGDMYCDSDEDEDEPDEEDESSSIIVIGHQGTARQIQGQEIKEGNISKPTPPVMPTTSASFSSAPPPTPDQQNATLQSPRAPSTSVRSTADHSNSINSLSQPQQVAWSRVPSSPPTRHARFPSTSQPSPSKPSNKPKPGDIHHNSHFHSPRSPLTSSGNKDDGAVDSSADEEASQHELQKRSAAFLRRFAGEVNGDAGSGEDETRDENEDRGEANEELDSGSAIGRRHRSGRRL